MTSYSKADVALFESPSITTPIKGSVPLSLAEHVLGLPGNVTVITTTGKSLKRILKAIKTKAFTKDLMVYGVNNQTFTIGGRTINDLENLLSF